MSFAYWSFVQSLRSSHGTVSSGIRPGFGDLYLFLFGHCNCFGKHSFSACVYVCACVDVCVRVCICVYVRACSLHIGRSSKTES